MSFIGGAITGYVLGTFFSDDNVLTWAIVGALIGGIVLGGEQDKKEKTEVAKEEKQIEQKADKSPKIKDEIKEKIDTAREKFGNSEDVFKRENVY